MMIKAITYHDQGSHMFNAASYVTFCQMNYVAMCQLEPWSAVSYVCETTANV